MRYLENELRHLCPLNPISCRCQTPSACWTNHIYKTELCPHHQAFSCLAPSMRVPNMSSSAGWGGLAVANAFRNRLLSSSSNPCLTCSIYVVWNCLETGPIWGAYFCFRVASMWHILVRLVYGCREIWGSCAIYVGIPSLILANEWELRHLCPKKAAWYWEKIIGGNQRRRLQKIDHHLGTYMAQLTCFEWELSHLSPAFCIWHRWRNSRFWAIYF